MSRLKRPLYSKCLGCNDHYSQGSGRHQQEGQGQLYVLEAGKGSTNKGKYLVFKGIVLVQVILHFNFNPFCNVKIIMSFSGLKSV